MRSLDRSLSAAEVVTLAEKKGLRLTPAFVYNIRSAEASRVSAPRGVIKPSARPTKTAASNGSPEALLRAAIAQIGLVRARQILEEVEDTFAGR